MYDLWPYIADMIHCLIDHSFCSKLSKQAAMATASAQDSAKCMSVETAGISSLQRDCMMWYTGWATLMPDLATTARGSCGLLDTKPHGRMQPQEPSSVTFWMGVMRGPTLQCPWSPHNLSSQPRSVITLPHTVNITVPYIVNRHTTPLLHSATLFHAKFHLLGVCRDHDWFLPQCQALHGMGEKSSTVAGTQATTLYTQLGC